MAFLNREKLGAVCRTTGVMLALALLASCATVQSMPPERQVEAAAYKRWEHLIEGRWAEAYNMLSPAYRAVNSLKVYQSTFKGAVKWQRVNVASVSCEPEKCTARVEVVVLNPMARRNDDFLSTFISETWIADGGDWYFVEK